MTAMDWSQREWLEGLPPKELWPLLDSLTDLQAQVEVVLDQLQCPSRQAYLRCKRFRGHPEPIHDADPYVFTNTVGIFGASSVGTSWEDPPGAVST